MYPWRVPFSVDSRQAIEVATKSYSIRLKESKYINDPVTQLFGLEKQIPQTVPSLSRTIWNKTKLGQGRSLRSGTTTTTQDHPTPFKVQS